jgi:tetrahydromethanopterin S-methyltransferase subunit A
MLDNDSEITVERLQEIIELLREFELETPEEIALIVQELAREVVRLQLRVADLVKFIESEGGGG